MKKKILKKKILLIMLMFVFMPHVKAECDNDRINDLKNLAKNVEITYELDENKSEEELKAYDSNDIAKGVVKIIITGLTENFSIIYDYSNRTYEYQDTDEGVLIINDVPKGNKKFSIYSNECNKIIKTLFIKIPTYNKYSLDPLCQDIPKEELSVCDTWYESTISYDDFKKKIENYHEFKKEDIIEEKQTLIDRITDFLKNNYLYIGLSIVLIIAIIIFIKVRRKRSELE